MFIIYSLSSSSDPNNIRYIGKTENIKDRLRRHIGKYNLNNEKTYKNNWIKSEISKGNKIILKEVERIIDNWQEREKYWISYFLNEGYKLVNTTEGGEGIILTDEIIKKRNKSNSDKPNILERIKKFQIKENDEHWTGKRKCKCGNTVIYKSKKRSSVLANIKRAEEGNRVCNSCKVIIIFIPLLFSNY